MALGITEIPRSIQIESLEVLKRELLRRTLDLLKLIFCPDIWQNFDITFLTPDIPLEVALVKSMKSLAKGKYVCGSLKCRK